VAGGGVAGGGVAGGWLGSGIGSLLEFAFYYTCLKKIINSEIVVCAQGLDIMTSEG
jgi:hypothetical protein